MNLCPLPLKLNFSHWNTKRFQLASKLFHTSVLRLTMLWWHHQKHFSCFVPQIVRWNASRDTRVECRMFLHIYGRDAVQLSLFHQTSTILCFLAGAVVASLWFWIENNFLHKFEQELEDDSFPTLGGNFPAFSFSFTFFFLQLLHSFSAVFWLLQRYSDLCYWVLWFDQESASLLLQTLTDAKWITGKAASEPALWARRRRHLLVCASD